MGLGSLSAEQLARIALLDSQGQGVLSPEAVVEDATPRGAVLHGLFEWDDRKASHQYRIGQARTIIASVRIERVVTEVEAPREIMYVRDPGLRGQPGYRRSDSAPAQENSSLICAYYLKRALASLAGAKVRTDAMGCDWPIAEAVEQIAAFLRTLEGEAHAS